MDEIIALARQLLELLESYKEQLPKERSSETRDEMEILEQLFKQPSQYSSD